MKVRSVGFDVMHNIESKQNKEKADFSQSFNQANKFKSKEELDSYIKEIKSMGQKIVVTQNYNDVLQYKKAIKGYLKSIADYMYSINKKNSFWEGNYFTTVRTVNEKLEEITRELIYDQKESIDTAAKIDEINGLLIDIYM